MALSLVSDDHIQLGAQMCLTNKKSSCKRITGFQVKLFLFFYFFFLLALLPCRLNAIGKFVLILIFCECSFLHKTPAKYWLHVLIHKSESLMGRMWLGNIEVFAYFFLVLFSVMMSCHSLKEYNLSCYWIILILFLTLGLRNSGNQISALFTSDGKHIVSAFEDSNVYVWNYIDKVVSSASHPKAIRSFECFSSDASVAIPWSGMSIENPENRFISSLDKNSINSLPFSASTRFFLSQEFLLESNPRGSATWPEEKLPVSIPRVPTSPVCRSQYKLFKNSYQSSSSSHLWGLVIVTAGWDGRIRTFHNYGLPIPLWDKATWYVVQVHCMLSWYRKLVLAVLRPVWFHEWHPEDSDPVGPFKNSAHN